MKKIAPLLAVAGPCLLMTIMFLFIGAGIAFAIFTVLGGSAGGSDSSDKVNTSNWGGSKDCVRSIGGATMPATSGKVGHEEHMPERCLVSGQSHYTDRFSSPVTFISNCAAFGAKGSNAKTQEQERWYFNMRWNTGSGYPGDYVHKKVIITNPVNNKRLVASVEEYGPAAFLWTRDGINSGATPDVYKYLGLSNPYTRNPNDRKGFATYCFAKDQAIPLGPL